MILGLSAATAAVAATSAVSSFAWFAINDTVDATGMIIKADTSEYLEIKNANTGATGVWGNTAASNQGVKTLKAVHLAKEGTQVSPATSPVTYSAVTAYTDNDATHIWVSSFSDDLNSATKGADASYTDVTTEADYGYGAKDASSSDVYSKNVYTLVNDFDLRIRYSGDTTSTYTLSATVDWVSSVPSDEKTNTISSGEGTTEIKSWFHNCARVFMVVGSMNADEDKMTVNSQSAGKTFTSENSSASSDWSDDKKTLTSTLVASNKGSDTLGTGVRVRTFVYFDGEDSNCFTNAVTIGNQYSLKFNFSVKKNA